jgi:hypothetical protein
MWHEQIVPPFNSDSALSVASIERVAQLLADQRAQFWIGHDRDLTARLSRAPQYYE